MKEKIKNNFKYVVLLVILFIPFIYSFFYLKAYWNPYGKGNIDNLPVAIVNSDSGDKGSSVVDGIKNSKKLKLSVVSEKKAEDGLYDGTYYAVIRIPEDFTSSMESASTESKKHATITYSPNQKSSYYNSLIKPKKYNNEKEKDNKFILNKSEENYTKSFWPNIHLLLSSISISKNSIYRINYDPHGIMRRSKKIIGTKTFSIFSYTKSLIFRKNKKKYEYLTLFRMHLLSEEHLLKSHIKMVLFEKKYNLDDEEKTDVLECYNEL